MINTEVQYNHSEHKYFLGTTVYRSATQILEHFKNKFDTEEMSAQMEHRYNAPQQKWKDAWKKETDISLVRGNKLHGKEEQFLYNQGYTMIHDKPFIVFNMNLYRSPVDYGTLPDGVYPELKLWRHDWKIAGRADKPTFETVFGTRYAHVEDYKSNKRIRDRAFNGRRMLAPLEHLEDCELSHYTLQLSIYQFMLEYFGFKPGIRRVIHFGHAIDDLPEPSPQPYELPYLRDEVIAMLTHLKQTGWLN